MTSLTVGAVEQLKNLKSTQSFTENYMDNKDLVYTPTSDFYSWNNIVVSDKMGKEKRLTTGGQERTAIKRVEHKFHTEITTLLNYFEKTYYKAWVDAIKDYSLSNIERKLLLKQKKKEFMTNEIIPLIRSMVDKVVVGLFTGKYTIKIYAIQQSFADYAKYVQNLVERGFSSSKTKKTIIDSATEALLLGVGFFRSFFQTPDYEKITNAIINGDTFEAETTYPGTEYISPFCILGDPLRDFYSQPIVYRDIFSIDYILQKKRDIIKLEKDQIAIIMNNPKRFSNKNYKKINMIKYHENEICNGGLGYTLGNFDDYFKIDEKDRLVEYCEYWSKDNYVILLNGYVVYDGPNPLPTKKHPFYVVNYTRKPGTRISDGIGILLSGTQKLYSALYNMMYDIAKMNASPYYILKSNQHIEGIGNYLDVDAYKIQKVRGDVNFELLNTPKLDASTFKVMGDLLEVGRLLVAPSVYNELQGVSRSATDAEYRYESLRDNIRPLSESINECFNHLVKDWILFSKEYMPEKFRIFVLGEDKKPKYPLIKREYLMGNYLIETEFDSLKDVNKALEREQAVKFLQLLPSIMKDPVDNRILVDMEKLFRDVSNLFFRTSDFVLDEKDFYRKLEESNKKMQEIQAKLAEQQKELQAKLQEIQGGGQEEQNMQEQVNTEQDVPQEELEAQQLLGL